MKSPGKSHHAAEVPLFKRHRENGVSVYHDPIEAEAAWIFGSTYGFDLGAFDDWLESPGWKDEQRQAALDYRRRVIAACAAHNREAEELGVMLLKLMLEVNTVTLPPARHGYKMEKGRKRGIFGPVRRAVEQVLKIKKYREAAAAEVWRVLKEKPPKGMSFYESPTLGKYIETNGHPDTGYDRFATICSEVRKSLK